MPRIHECIIENAASATKEEKKINRRHTTHTLETFIDFTLKLSANYFDVVSYIAYTFFFGLCSKRKNAVIRRRRHCVYVCMPRNGFVRNEQSYTTRVHAPLYTILNANKIGEKRNQALSECERVSNGVVVEMRKSLKNGNEKTTFKWIRRSWKIWKNRNAL